MGTRGRAGPRLVVLCALLASVPVWVAAIDAVSAGWIPLGDKAFTAVRAWDVFSIHPPLTGQWSSGATVATGATTYSPGPLLFWLLAIPVRLPWQSSLEVVMAIVNTAAIGGTLFLARRRGGDALMLATAILIPVMLASLPGDVYADVWNSSAPLMPLILLVFLSWSLACGDSFLLPVTVVVASFVAQSHLTFVAPALGLVAVGIAGFIWNGIDRSARRWILLSLALLGLCWLLPALDQLAHRPGNAVLIVRSARADVPRLGLDAGWHAVVHAVGVLPWWLRPPRDAKTMSSDIGSASALAVVSTLAILGCLLTALWRGLQRRAPNLAAAGALGLVLCASILSVASSTPRSEWFTFAYTLRWATPAGMCVWILAGWSVLTMLAPARGRVLPRPALAAGAAILAAASLAVAFSVDLMPQASKQVQRAADEIEARIPESQTILVQGDLTLGSAFALADVEGGIVAQLHRDGRKVVLPLVESQGFGNRYVGPYDTFVFLQVDQAPKKGTLLAKITTPDLLTRRERTVYASLVPVAKPQASLRPSTYPQVAAAMPPTTDVTR